MERKNLKKKSKPKKQPISKKNIITSLILIGFAFFGSYLIYFILQIALDTQTPMVVVVSGSMEPNINKGDLLFLRGMDAEDIKEQDGDHEGDVIVYDNIIFDPWVEITEETPVERDPSEDAVVVLLIIIVSLLLSMLGLLVTHIFKASP